MTWRAICGCHLVKDLTTLIVCHNEITCLPEEVGTLTMLEKLDIGHNRLTGLPGGKGLTLVPISAQLELFCPPYHPT